MRIVAALALGLSLPAAAQGDAVGRGEQRFAWCYACHSVISGEDGLPGPNLYGIVGSQAAARSDFPYSAALIRLREEGVVWDIETLDAFLADPTTFAPDNAMDFFGIAEPGDRADLLAFLVAVSEDG